jgi:hypothetical protein
MSEEFDEAATTRVANATLVELTSAPIEIQ